MEVVKVVRGRNGKGKPYIRLGVPTSLVENLEGVTHMSVESDGLCILYRPAITEPWKET